MDTSRSLRGRVAIITGAGKGLGKAWALQQFGRLDIVVANAGIDSAASFHKLPMADFERVMEVNFHAVARLLHAAWPVLREQRYGRVLVSGSTAGLYGNHGQAAYASAKAALLGLVKTLAIEGAPRGVLVNLLAPYAVTQLTRGAFVEGQLGQFSAAAVAPLVAWLVSEHCGLTGQTIVTGAAHARLVKTLESETVALGENIPAALQQLTAMPCDQALPTAIAEFEAFTRSLPGADSA